MNMRYPLMLTRSCFCSARWPPPGRSWRWPTGTGCGACWFSCWSLRWCTRSMSWSGGCWRCRSTAQSPWRSRIPARGRPAAAAPASSAFTAGSGPTSAERKSFRRTAASSSSATTAPCSTRWSWSATYTSGTSPSSPNNCKNKFQES